LLLLVLPSLAQANMGTPLMWAGALHLVFGNLIIGLIEGLLLAKVFGRSTRKCVGLLILANYFSAWLGTFLIQPMAHSLPMDLRSAWPLFWLMVAVTYALTLVLEFPFVALAFRGDPSWRRKSIRGSFLIQTVSYAILFGWYSLASSATLYTRTDVVEISAMSLPESVLVYFISVDDGSVYGGSLRERQWRRVFDPPSQHQIDCLLIRRSPQNANTWDLVARPETKDYLGPDFRPRKPDLITLEEGLAAAAVPSWRGMNPDRPGGEWPNHFGQAPKLGDAQSSSWEFQVAIYAEKGLRGADAASKRAVSLSFATPYMMWHIMNATHLPTDKVLLQLGDDQICVYDPIKNQIALLARGRGPIAVMDKREPKQLELQGDPGASLPASPSN